MRIAVLDDNVALGEMLQASLELLGYTASVFYSPASFLAAFSAPPTAQTPFDVIIVDLLLSDGMSGVEVITRARQIFPGLHAILITAGSSWDIEKARRAMPDIKVLRKPFILSALMALVKKLST